MKNETPQTVEETIQKLKIILPNLPKRMRQCGDYVSTHYDQIIFSTVTEISEKAGVQPSAMMRFCNLLGFRGYSDMQKIFRNTITRVSPDYTTRIENLRSNNKLSTSHLLAEFVDAGRFSLEKLAHEIQENDLDIATKLMAKANLIHIVGYKRAFPIASCLSYTLERLQIPNIFHDSVGKMVKYSSIQKDDVVVAITFAPYTSETVDMVEEAIKRGNKIIAISDSEISPIYRDGVCFLKVVDIDVGDFRSLAASISLAMALAVSVGLLRV